MPATHPSHTRRPDALCEGSLTHGHRLTRLIGTGAMSKVYRALHVESEEWRAVKVLERLTGSLPARALREARILETLRHPNVLGYRGVWLHSGRPCVALELVEHGDLNRVLARGVDLERGWELGDQLLAALEMAHDLGIVHRDLKPSNALIGADGRLRLGDFGLSSMRDPELDLTRTGSVLGTLGYCAPEQLRNAKGVGPTADVFAAGAILYELLTGKPVFVTGNLIEAWKFSSSECYVPACERRPELPAEVGAMLQRALRADPDLRYPNAGELRTAWRAGRTSLERARLL